VDEDYAFRLALTIAFAAFAPFGVYHRVRLSANLSLIDGKKAVSFCLAYGSAHGRSL
jgi:hypothetical protein